MNFLFTQVCHFQKFRPNLKLFVSQKASSNHYSVFIYGFSTELLRLLKTKVDSFFISLIDIVGLDLSKLSSYSAFFNSTDTNMSPAYFDKAVLYNCLDYKSSNRTLLTVLLNKSEGVRAVSTSFNNAIWLERELVEFFNVSVSGRSDTRNLLLDYNITANPLLKSYPTEGHQEIFFNHLTYNLEYVGAEFVEL